MACAGVLAVPGVPGLSLVSGLRRSRRWVAGSGRERERVRVRVLATARTSASSASSGGSGTGEGGSKKVDVLLVGSGGREHALAWSMQKSGRLGRLWAVPGNPGMSADGVECVEVGGGNAGLVAFAKAEGVGLVVVGPEAPLVDGLADAMAAEGVPVFGPSRAASALEGSKAFMKGIAAKYGVPSASYETFKDAGAAKAFIRAHGAPVVVKTDGLAAGKGALVCGTVEEAERAVEQIMEERAFGDAGDTVVVEGFLEGEEASFFAVCDGETAVPLVGAQDHKRAYDGDEGPNTGGMGAYSPAPVFTAEVQRKTMERIVLPTLRGMAAEECPFRGVLFAGLMVDSRGDPSLIEFNIRFGDPECQVLMARLESDLLELLEAAAAGDLAALAPLRWSDESALVVVVAADGYPGAYAKGSPLGDLAAAERSAAGVKIFHAGTAQDAQGRIVSNGGRVLGVTSRAATVAEARARAYQAVDTLAWKDGFVRRDIAWRALERDA